MRVQDVDVLLGVDRGAQDQQLLPAVYAQEPAVHQHGRLHLVLQLRPHLQRGEQQAVGRHFVVEVVPVVAVIWGQFLLFEFGVEIVQVDALDHGELVHDWAALLQLKHHSEDVLESADVVGVFAQLDHFFGGEVAPEEFLKQEDVVRVDLKAHVDFGRVTLAQRQAR